MKRLRPEDVNAAPFKTTRSPMRDLIYIKDDASRILIDPAHTYAIDGVGKSYLASSIVLLAIMEIWGTGSMEHRFEIAYNKFLAFCTAHDKNTTVEEFSHKTLKLPTNSPLGP